MNQDANSGANRSKDSTKSEAPSPADQQKTAGSNVQSQGGIGHKAASAAGDGVDPHAGSPKGAGAAPGPSLDEGGDEQPHGHGAHNGFSGDDGRHRATDSNGTAATLQPGRTADSGAQGDQRRHAVPDDPAERASGADTPNEGGIAGSPGGPRNAPERVPGQDRDSDAITGGSQNGNDSQRDSQI